MKQFYSVVLMLIVLKLFDLGFFALSSNYLIWVRGALGGSSQNGVFLNF